MGWYLQPPRKRKPPGGHHPSPRRAESQFLLELVECRIGTLRNHFNTAVAQVACEPAQAQPLCLAPHVPPEPHPLHPPPHDPAAPAHVGRCRRRSEEHTSELQSQFHLVCRL